MTRSSGVKMNETVCVKVYPITGSLIDLFFGDGWDDWTRVYVSAKVGHPVTRKDVTVLGGAKRSVALLVASVEAWRSK